MNELLLYVEILLPALIAGLLILLTHIPLGAKVLAKGIIFFDLAIAQLAAFGVVLSALLLDIAQEKWLTQSIPYARHCSVPAFCIICEPFP